MENQSLTKEFIEQPHSCSIERRLNRTPRTCFKQVPISSDVAHTEIKEVYLSGFESSHNLNILENKLKELCFSVLSKEERSEYFREQRALTEFRKKTLKMTLIGDDTEVLRKPQTPISNKLDFLLYQFEVEITKKVVENMSSLTRRVLEVEFQLQEKQEKKCSLIPRDSYDESQMINSFYEKLKLATECAISEKQRNI